VRTSGVVANEFSLRRYRVMPAVPDENFGAPEDVAVSVVDGICGEAACCGVMATITIAGDTAVWSDFHAPGGPPPPEGLRFEFDRTAYTRWVDGGW
jgi:hypothetical protein